MHSERVAYQAITVKISPVQFEDSQIIDYEVCQNQWSCD